MQRYQVKKLLENGMRLKTLNNDNYNNDKESNVSEKVLRMKAGKSLKKASKIAR